jgi:predicted nucleic acid-binding protein
MPPKIIPFIPGRTRLPRDLYLDANCLVSWYLAGHAWHRRANQLMKAVRRYKLGLHVSTLSVDEAWWKILAVAYERDHGPRSWHSAIVRDDPSVLRDYFPELRKFTTRLLALRRVQVIDQIGSKELVTQALDNIRDHSLAPRDAFHLALALAIGIPNIVTNDIQFQKIDADWLSVITFF